MLLICYVCFFTIMHKRGIANDSCASFEGGCTWTQTGKAKLDVNKIEGGHQRCNVVKPHKPQQNNNKAPHNVCLNSLLHIYSEKKKIVLQVATWGHCAREHALIVWRHWSFQTSVCIALSTLVTYGPEAIENCVAAEDKLLSWIAFSITESIQIRYI